jgi:hypothetical protein
MSLAKRLETITIIGVAVLAIMISLLDLAGIIDGLPWLRNRVSVLTLLVVGAVAAYLISDRFLSARDQSDEMRQALRDVVEALHGIEVRQFASRAEFWAYAAERIQGSRKSIDDLTWGRVPASFRTAQDIAAYKEYRRQIKLVATGRGGNRIKTFREIMSFPDAVRLPYANEMMREEYTNYHLRYYAYDHDGTPPLLQFYVFDKSEVLISLISPSGSSLDNRYISFKSHQLADVMSYYFEMAWQDAIILKDTERANTELLQAIEARFREPGSEE